MKHIKVSLSPPYKPENECYATKVECSIEFDLESEAINFTRELNMLIIQFKKKISSTPDDIRENHLKRVMKEMTDNG